MTSKADVAERHIEIGDLAVLLWRAKFAILGIVLIAAIIAAVIVYQKPDVYRSELKAQPAEGLARSTGGLGGLSALGSIAGIELGADAVKGVDLAIAILQSRKFLTDFAQRHNAIVPLLEVGTRDQRPQERTRPSPAAAPARSGRAGPADSARSRRPPKA